MTRILVVDDDRSVRELVELNLTMSGYDVLTAPDGDAALASIRRDRPDLILLDVMMPGVDGRSVATTVRCDPELRDIAIIYLSACSSDADVWRGWRTGADSYLCKPFDPARMVDEVDRVLGARRSLTENTPEGQRVVLPDITPDAARSFLRGAVRWSAARPKLAGASL